MAVLRRACCPTPRWRCAKADLHIARRYVELWDDAEPRERIWGALRDGVRAHRAPSCCSSRDEERLLDREPVLQASIDRRNPYVDPLSFVQVELLRRLRARRRRRREALERVSLLTINGIAGGLRNTG